MPELLVFRGVDVLPNGGTSSDLLDSGSDIARSLVARAGCGQGAGSREPGAGSREPGAGSREPGAGSRAAEGPLVRSQARARALKRRGRSPDELGSHVSSRHVLSRRGPRTGRGCLIRLRFGPRDEGSGKLDRESRTILTWWAGRNPEEKRPPAVLAPLRDPDRDPEVLVAKASTAKAAVDQL